jgi:hypothetical protein
MGTEPTNEKADVTRVASLGRGHSASVQIASDSDTEAVHRASGKGRLDIAAEYLKQQEINHEEYTAAEAKRVLWKIDLVVVPLMTATVTLCAVDVSTCRRLVRRVVGPRP